MAEANYKKWFVLLVALVSLSLVVNLLYLSALYDIARSNSILGGELGTWWLPWSFSEEASTYYESQTEPMDPEHDRYSSSYSSEPEPTWEERYATEMASWGSECDIDAQCSNDGDKYCFSNDVVRETCEKGYCVIEMVEECYDDTVCTEWWYFNDRNEAVVLPGVYRCMDSAAP